MAQKKESQLLEAIENIIAAAQHSDSRMERLESIARHPDNIQDIKAVRRRLALIEAETRRAMRLLWPEREVVDHP